MNKFELISLPYSPNALEPVLSAETIAFHHGTHLQT
ncbi:MAG: superoxide dismutase, partial [Prevotella sp.]|nr:superoxide dismutase [Prevotella sp.]